MIATEPVPVSTNTTELGRGCPSCGADCKPGVKFCGKCGHAFAPAAPAAPATAPTPTPTPTPDVRVTTEAGPSGRPGARAIVALVVASVGALGVFAWWLTSRGPAPAPAAQEVGLPEPSAEASEASVSSGVLTSGAQAPLLPASVATPVVPTEIIEHEPVVVPVAPPAIRVDEAAQAQARRQKVEEEARQEQVRRDEQAKARQREQDKAKLNQANKTLDDLLK